MKMLDTPHKKKSAGLTAAVAVLLLLLFFVLGLTYYDPPVSYGMEVNFGTLAQGSGKVQPKKSVQTVEQVVDPPQEIEEKEASTPPQEKTPEPIEEVLTEKESTVAIPEKKEEKDK